MKRVKVVLLVLSTLICSGFVFADTINVPGDQPTIQAGINVAIDGDVVLVQSGTYVENINFNGKNIVVASLFYTTQDTSYISQTIIDGNQNGHVIEFSNDEDSTAVLCGFSVINGLTYYGGGIYCTESSPTINNVKITNNNAVGEFAHGGGMYCDESSPNLFDVLIAENSAMDNGGGMYCDESSPNLSNVIIDNNNADGNGGGIFFYESSSTLNNVIIRGNTATNECCCGGGVYLRNNSLLNLYKVQITDNIADMYGGSIYSKFSSLNASNSTISGNTVSEGGGAIYCYDNSVINLTNCILWGNYPQEIYISEYENPSSLIISYSDILGGENCIIINNNGIVNWLNGNIDNDPLFAEPLFNNFNLTWNSPCIDAGDQDSPLDPDGTITDMGAYYYDHSNYDLTFNSLADMNTARLGFGYTTDGASLYAVCGGTYEPPFYQINNIEKYDPNIDNWEIFVDELIPRRYCKAEYLQSTNSIYIFGGQTYYQTNPYTYTDTIEVVDVDNASVSYLPSNPIPTEYAGSATWNNKIYIFGGSQNGAYSDLFYEFDPTNNIWIQLPYMPEEKQTDGEIVDGILYVFGGYNGSASNRIDAYDIQNNEWSFIGYMPTGISAHHTTISGQYIWLIGDYDNLDFVAVFNTETYEFNQLNTNITGRRHCGTEVIGNYLYVYGGNIATGGPALSSLQYADISYLSIDDEPNVIPTTSTLFQNYPNPFNPETAISFSIKQNSKIELEIFNIKGQLVKSLINGQQNAGNHSVIWNGKDDNGNKVTSGIYLYKLQVNDKSVATRKCLLLK